MGSAQFDCTGWGRHRGPHPTRIRTVGGHHRVGDQQPTRAPTTSGGCVSFLIHFLRTFGFGTADVALVEPGQQPEAHDCGVCGRDAAEDQDECQHVVARGQPKRQGAPEHADPGDEMEQSPEATAASAAEDSQVEPIEAIPR